MVITEITGLRTYGFYALITMLSLPIMALSTGEKGAPISSRRAERKTNSSAI
jgi:hypothetical protein